MTRDEALALFRYDREVGKLFWFVVTNNRVAVGDEAGCVGPNGYRRVRIDGKLFYVHRLVWCLETGYMPQPGEDIDHRDHDKDNNRFENLRLVTNSVNQQNRIRAQSGNKSGFLGASWHKRDRKWRARIQLDGKNIHLGNFDTPEEAHAAYLAAKRRLHPGNTL